MKESTIIIDAEFTLIKKHSDDFCFDLNKTEIAEHLKAVTGADDVLVTGAKVFESEVQKE